ncbi:MAG: hypothetical protein NC131_21595, partial [Roseburia sp.]|nr:hypothetical protein [Roseburia sp.]
GIPHSRLAEELGEDCLVAVKEGEGFVTPEQTDKLQQFLDFMNNPLADTPPFPLPTILPDVLSRIDNSVYNSMKFHTPENLRESIGNNIIFQSGAFNINLNEMRDVTALGEAIVRELPNIVTRKLTPRP